MFRFKSLFYFLSVCMGIIFILSTSSVSAFAETKTFIKEYTYQASEDDSRNSSRVIALREVKRLLLEELGTYLESETEVKNFQLTKDQITTLTAGIVQTEIIDEKWDGRMYWLKSKITADSDKVVQSINDLRKDRQKTQELESMKRKSDEQLKEIERLRKDLASAKDGNREANKAAYDKSIKELSATDWIEKGYAASDKNESVKAYSRAIELDPNNAEAYYLRAVTYLSLGEKTLAIQDYRQVIAIEPKSIDAYNMRARSYQAMGNPDFAIREYEKAIESASGMKTKARAYSLRGSYYVDQYFQKNDIRYSDLAMKDYSKAIDLDPRNVDWYLHRANTYNMLNKNDLAVKDYSKAIELNPNMGNTYFCRALFYTTGEGNPALAIRDFTKALELGLEKVWVSTAYYQRAGLYKKIGKTELALQDYSKAIKVEPDSGSLYSLRSMFYAELGKNDLALQDYSKAIEFAAAQSEKAAAYYSRAQFLDKTGKIDAAIQDFGKAIELDPGNKYYYFFRAELNDKLGKHDLVIQDYGKIIELTSEKKEKIEAYAQRGKYYAKIGRYDLACQDFTKAIELSPEKSEAYVDRGESYAGQGKHELAISDFNLAIKKAPYPGAFSARGISYLALDKRELAVKDLNTVIAGSSDWAADAYYHRAIIRALEGNSQKAIADLKKAIQVDNKISTKPTLKEKAKTESRFDSIRKHHDFIKLMGK